MLCQDCSSTHFCPPDKALLQEGDSEGAPASMTEALFGGMLSSQVVCDDCGHKAVTLEPFYNLSLPIPSKLRAYARSAACL